MCHGELFDFHERSQEARQGHHQMVLLLLLVNVRRRRNKRSSRPADCRDIITCSARGTAAYVRASRRRRVLIADSGQESSDSLGVARATTTVIILKQMIETQSCNSFNYIHCYTFLTVKLVHDAKRKGWWCVPSRLTGHQCPLSRGPENRTDGHGEH